MHALPKHLSEPVVEDGCRSLNGIQGCVEAATTINDQSVTGMITERRAFYNIGGRWRLHYCEQSERDICWRYADSHLRVRENEIKLFEGCM